MATYRQAQKIPLEGLQDRRRKLTEEDRKEIKELYEVKKLGIREISRIFEKVCSRRLIQFVLFPHRLKELQERNKDNEHWKKYHKKEESTKAVRNWRNYKYNLFKAK